MENYTTTNGLLARMHGLEEVIFGRGTASWLGDLTQRFGTKALICTDDAIAGTGILDRIASTLESCDIKAEVFHSTPTDFDTESVEEPATVARRIQPDVIIGLGGGSCIDMAKLVAVVISHEVDLPDLIGEGKVAGPIRPVVAVPTTAGTGSEVSPVAVFSDPSRGQKVGISSRHLVPRAALVDPALTDSCPPFVTASSGMDALSHAIEALIAIQHPTLPDSVPLGFFGKNPISDVFALRAVHLIGRFLECATTEATQDARDAMSLASLLAGVSFATAGTGLAHAIQYPLGHLTSTAHGVGVGFLLPYVMAFASLERSIDLLAIASSLNTPVDEDPGIAAILAIHSLGQRVGLPKDLKGFGLAFDDLPLIAERALGNSRLVNNAPRRPDAGEMMSILKAAWRGDPTALLST